MRGRVIGIGISALVLGAWMGVAWPAAPGPVKVGSIDVARVIETSEKGKEVREKVLQLRKDKERLLSTKGEDLNKLRQDFLQKSVTLSDRARLDKEQEIRQKEMEFQALSETSRQEVLMEGRKLQTLMLRELSEVVRQIGQQEGFTIIVDRDATLYVSDAIDLTEKVIQQYNAQAGRPTPSGEKKKK
jgi:outer membrane protein